MEPYTFPGMPPFIEAAARRIGVKPDRLAGLATNKALNRIGNQIVAAQGYEGEARARILAHVIHEREMMAVALAAADGAIGEAFEAYGMTEYDPDQWKGVIVGHDEISRHLFAAKSDPVPEGEVPAPPDDPERPGGLIVGADGSAPEAGEGSPSFGLLPNPPGPTDEAIRAGEAGPVGATGSTGPIGDHNGDARNPGHPVNSPGDALPEADRLPEGMGVVKPDIPLPETPISADPTSDLPASAYADTPASAGATPEGEVKTNPPGDPQSSGLGSTSDGEPAVTNDPTDVARAAGLGVDEGGNDARNIAQHEYENEMATRVPKSVGPNTRRQGRTRP